MVSILPHNKDLCSIEINAKGIAIACATNSTDPELKTCLFSPCQDNNQIKQRLMDIVIKNNLKKMKCNWVLHPSQYHLKLTNTPNVPQVEYKNAVRWQIKDIISYSLEDAAIEIFHPDEFEKRPKKIYVIAAQSSFLQNIIDIIQECYLHPIAIDIREFAIRNLITNLTPENEPIGFIDIVAESCSLIIMQQNRIKFVRRTPFGWQKLKDGNYNELTTELQRSFNYCITELKQTIPTKFFLPPTTDIDNDIAKNITTSLGKKVTVLNLQKLLHFTQSINSETVKHCWAAIGGTLRK